MTAKILASVTVIFGLALQAQADEWSNVSESTAVKASSIKLQKAARDLSNAVGLEDRSLMVQFYNRAKAPTDLQENDILAESLLREVYWGPMAPEEVKVKSLTSSSADLEAALTLIKSDLPEVNGREARSLASALKNSFNTGLISRIAYEFSAVGGRCVGLLLISADQKQVVEVANCHTK